MPDTGINKCYNDTAEILCPTAGQNFYGQDANYSINLMSYTKLDSSGNALPVTATAWAMIKDNVTGLIWENNSHSSTWDNAPNVVAELNNTKFGGYSDWRLPTMTEFGSIVDFSIPYPGPTINTNYFKDTFLSFYWSATTYAVSTSNAWGVNFFNGSGGSNTNKSNGGYVRAVRTGQSTTGSFGTLAINGDGTVSDSATGLTWQQDTAKPATGGTTMVWKDALAYCENLNLGGYTDWRLPTVKELHSIVDYTVYSPAIDTNIFKDTFMFIYWSSTTYSYDSSYAWGVSFYSGYDYGGYKNYYYYVRAVRGGHVENNTTSSTLSLSSSSGASGTTATVNLSLTNVTGVNVAAISTDIDFDPAIFEAYPSDATNAKNPSAVIGAAGTAAGKSITYSLVDSNTLRVGVFSMSNTTAIANGVVASITFYIKSTATNGFLTDLTQIPSGSDSNSNPITITGTKGSVTINSCKLGDCDCNGTVSIAEIQSAVNMYLGKKTVASCCDRDGNGSVSISEVQAIVNNYLGKVVASSTYSARAKKRAAQVGVEHVADGYSLNLKSNGNKIAAISFDIAYPVELADKISFELGASAELSGKELIKQQIQPGIIRIGVIDAFDNQPIENGEILFVKVDGDSAEGDVSFKVTASDEAGKDIDIK